MWPEILLIPFCHPQEVIRVHALIIRRPWIERSCHLGLRSG